MSTRFRFHYYVQGGHTHVRVFAGVARTGATLGSAGNLVFRNEEWEDFMASVEHGLIEFVPDKENEL